MRIDWQNIDTVLLDMDGTLLDLHFDNYFWLDYMPSIWAQQNDMPINDAKEHLAPIFHAHAGTLNWYCVDFWSDTLALDILQLNRDVSHKIDYRPQAKKFLRKCRQQSNDVRLVTNAHRKILNLKIEQTGIDQYFHKMLCSHELNAPKEDTKFWKRLHDTQAFDPKRTLFIDDNETVLESAERHGIQHLYSIAKPDSQRERTTPSRFPMFGDFEQA